MEVITFVKGTVPYSKIEEFKEGYKSLKEEPKPNGLIASYLLQDAAEEEVFIIETVWESPEALEKMRSEGEPAAPALFKKVGAKPTLKVYNMLDAI